MAMRTMRSLALRHRGTVDCRLYSYGSGSRQSTTNLPAKVQLDGNVKHINRGKVGAPKVKPCLEEQHVERQYDQRADERFLSEWQGDLDLRGSNRGAAGAPRGTTCVR